MYLLLGDAGSKFYIALSGAAWVFVPKTEEELTKEEAHLSKLAFRKVSGDSQQSIAVSPEKSIAGSPKAHESPAFGFSPARNISSEDECEELEPLVRSSTKKKSTKMYEQRPSTVDLERILALERVLKSGQLKVGGEVIAEDKPKLQLTPEKRTSLSHQERTGTSLTLKKNITLNHLAVPNPRVGSSLSPTSNDSSSSPHNPHARTKTILHRKKGDSYSSPVAKDKRKVRLLIENQDIPEEDPAASPRMNSFLQTTDPQSVTPDVIALLSSKRNRNLYLKNNMVLMKLATTLETGDYIGERALFHNSTRAATVVVSQEMQLVTLRKESFQRIFKIQQQKTEAKMSMISSLFQNMWSGEMKKLMVCFSETTYQINKKIYQEGDKLNGIFIVKEGQVKVRTPAQPL